MSSAARRPRQPIADVRDRVVSSLSAPARAEVEAECYALWSEFFEGMTRARFVETHIFDDTRLVTAYGRDGRLAGFFNLNTQLLDAAGERVLLLGCGVFIRREYDAYGALLRRGWRSVLRLRLRHPLARFLWQAIYTSPVAYQAMCEGFRVFYPHPTAPTPAYVTRALAECCRHRGFVQDEDDPFVVDFSIKQRLIDELKASSRLRNPDANAAYFIERVPAWESGKGLIGIIPVNLVNIASSARMAIQRRRRRA
ncbi:MAG: hypothetical protein KC636_34860 [Myxococcales bacterium]|nr:hypothetical protein [Myxococcales bacterium]